jgi:hypothetical protein
MSDWFSMTQDPVSGYKLFNLGTSQRAKDKSRYTNPRPIDMSPAISFFSFGQWHF